MSRRRAAHFAYLARMVPVWFRLSRAARDSANGGSRPAACAVTGQEQLLVERRR